MGDGRLSGRRVLVTDADAFMGPDIAAYFREAGADVLADSRDLTAPGAVRDLVSEAGRVDVLMANLAASFSGNLVDGVDEAELEMMFNRLVRPLHALTRAVLPQMKERRAGKIVVVGSAVGLKGVPRRAAYSAARGAQHAYVRNVGVELAAFGINMNATGQTFVENPTYFPEMTDELRKRLEQVPAGRLSTGREAAMFLACLAGPESDYFFGQVFPYAGGWVT